MRSIHRTIEAACVFGAAAILVQGITACRERLAAPMSAPQASIPRRGGTLHLAMIAEVRSLDPATTPNAIARPAWQAMYSGLVDYDDAGAVVPEIAERWDVTDEGKTYRFFLRQGVRFHDGDEVTADDVRRSIERALHPATANANSEYFDGIVGFDDFNAKKSEHLEGVAVEGRYVVTFRIKEPDPTFLMRLTLHLMRPVCKSGGERVDTTWEPCGAGPFKLAPGGLQRGIGLKVVRHEQYFRADLPHLDAIQWSFNMNAVNQRMKLELGDVDLLRDVTQGDLLRFMGDERWKPLGAFEADRGVFGETMNVSKPPFDNVELRRAVASAIDREQYRSIKPANLSPATQLAPPSTPGYTPHVNGQRFSIDDALEHMKRAGYAFDPKTGKGGFPRAITYTAYTPGFPEYSSQILQQQLAKIGIKLEIRLITGAAWYDSMPKGQNEFGPLGWSPDYLDATAFFSFLESDQSSPGYSPSGSFYKNARFDELSKKARVEGDLAKRQALLDEANQIVCDDAPWAFTHFYHYYEVRQPYVFGYASNLMWIQNVRFAWIDRGGAESPLASREGSLFGASRSSQ